MRVRGRHRKTRRETPASSLLPLGAERTTSSAHIPFRSDCIEDLDGETDGTMDQVSLNCGGLLRVNMLGDAHGPRRADARRAPPRLAEPTMG